MTSWWLAASIALILLGMFVREVVDARGPECPECYHAMRFHHGPLFDCDFKLPAVTGLRPNRYVAMYTYTPRCGCTMSRRMIRMHYAIVGKS